MTVFLDTSVVLRVLLGQPDRLPSWGRWRRAYVSEIMGVEARRALDRMRLAGELDDGDVIAAQEWLRIVEPTMGRIPLTRAVLDRASQPLGTAVRTLDAIHLASALRLQEKRQGGVTFATHDTRQALAARSLGFLTVGA